MLVMSLTPRRLSSGRRRHPLDLLGRGSNWHQDVMPFRRPSTIDFRPIRPALAAPEFPKLF